MIKLNMRLKNADVIKERFLGAFILEANKFMQYSFFLYYFVGFKLSVCIEFYLGACVFVEARSSV